MRHRKVSLIRLALLTAWCLLLLAPGVRAQNYRGRIQGVVSDPTQASIPNATVTLLNTGTGLQTVRQTSEAGLYLFDSVEPGTYSITVDAPGFGKFVQENIVVQARADITVDASLKPGSVQDNITVTEAPAAVEFNSANRDLTIDTKMAQEMPRLDRNPFKLTLLAPSAVNTRGEMSPFHSWAANSVDLGGGTNLKNDLQVDGSPIGMGQKNSVTPNTDAVQEVIVSTNSVDAESGHSAGGLISIAMKSGTNEWHGTGFYLGRYPWANAEADRTRHSSNATRQHMMGGTLGSPIIKNKLFNFFSMEYWKVGSPSVYQKTMPTALERAGDFSKTYDVNGAVKTIYDPNTTILNSDGSVTRTPFAGNKIPSSRFDPLSASLLSSFWDPNGPGDNITGVNNYKKGYTDSWKYYNFSDRADYNINDRWRVYGRVSRYHTTDIAGDPTPNKSQFYLATGSLREGNQVSGDGVWAVSNRTVVNFHGDWHSLVDAFTSEPFGEAGWAKLWPNGWYKPSLAASKNVPVYFPYLNIGGNTFGGNGFYWDQRPAGMAYSAKISQQRGSHYLKAGIEHRRSYGPSYVSNTTQFFFQQAVTANTFSSPNLVSTGSGYASFLLGALDGSTQVVSGPAPDPHIYFWGMYFQDDWKLSRRITLNLGIRNEYESAFYDPEHNFSRGLDLSKPVPEMQANPPAIPAAATNIVGNNFYKWNGLWQWTSSDNPGMWDAPKLALQPRVGIAFRLNDLTALRFGYAMYTIPSEYNIDTAPISGFETVGFLSPPFFGMTGYQNTTGLIAGIPQQTFSNPFPANSNPLLAVTGKGYGTNLGRGGTALIWYPTDFKKPYNHRLNFNFQRQLPGQVVGSVTYFANFGNQLYTKALNNIDPNLRLKYQNTLSDKVANPFYNYLTPELFPAQLRNQQTVSLSQLLVPYPQYGGLYQIGTLGASERYHSLELKAQKQFSKGYNFLFAYVYIREKNQQFFNDLDVYNNNLAYQNSDQPRHRLTMAGTYELPFGKGKLVLNGANRVLDGIVGGWKLAGVYTHTSGQYLRFGDTLIVNGNPCADVPSGYWFNTKVFSQVPANTYVLRSNPKQYDCLRGPTYNWLDSTLTKNFRVTEKLHMEMKMAAYNTLNQLNLGAPSTSISDPNFGKALYQGSPGGTFGAQSQQLANVNGRQLEFGLKILF